MKQKACLNLEKMLERGPIDTKFDKLTKRTLNFLR